MKKADCLRLEYFRGSADPVQGVKSYEKDHYDINQGYFKNTGGGNGVFLTGSKLILFVFAEKDAIESEVYVDRFFKEKVGRLTTKRLTIIEKTMPATVDVREETRKDGTKYYKLSDKDLSGWLARYEQEIENTKKKKR